MSDIGFVILELWTMDTGFVGGLRVRSGKDKRKVVSSLDFLSDLIVLNDYFVIFLKFSKTF